MANITIRLRLWPPVSVYGNDRIPVLARCPPENPGGRMPVAAFGRKPPSSDLRRSAETPLRPTGDCASCRLAFVAHPRFFAKNAGFWGSGGQFAQFQRLATVFASKIAHFGTPRIVSGTHLLIWGTHFVLRGVPFLIRGMPFFVRGIHFTIPGMPFFILGTRFVVRGMRFVVRGTRPFVPGIPLFIWRMRFWIRGARFFLRGFL